MPITCTEIQNQIKQQLATGEKLQIMGAGSRLSATQLTPLSLKSYCGIVDYQPSELVVTVKAGTTLVELQQVLAEKNQMLSFEPPDFGGSTIGGSYACGLSGSGQAFRANLRDCVLGIKLINGLGKSLTFGGQMIKNVAGYDVARLLVGSYGQLAVITEISLKVVPKVSETSYRLCLPVDEAIVLMNQWAGTSLPLSACAYYQDHFYYRLFGHHSKQSTVAIDNSIWQQLNPFQPPLATGDKLWRASVASTAVAIDNTVAIDHCGTRRWLVAPEPPDIALMNEWHQGMPLGLENQHPQQIKLTQGLKQVFDPHAIFNTLVS